MIKGSPANETPPTVSPMPERFYPAQPHLAKSPWKQRGPGRSRSTCRARRLRFPPRTPVRESREQRILDGQLGWGIRATLAGPLSGADGKREGAWDCAEEPSLAHRSNPSLLN